MLHRFSNCLLIKAGLGAVDIKFMKIKISQGAPQESAHHRSGNKRTERQSRVEQITDCET